MQVNLWSAVSETLCPIVIWFYIIAAWTSKTNEWMNGLGFFLLEIGLLLVMDWNWLGLDWAELLSFPHAWPWLWAREYILFQLCILMYKAIHGLAPCYLNELYIPVSTVLNFSALRSTARGDLVISRTRLQLGNRAFRVAGLVAWSTLPLNIRSAPTLSAFKDMLKTHLLSRSYFTD